jgi:hypothetical protein
MRQQIATFRHGIMGKFAYILLVYLDIGLTFIALRLGGQELNPFMQGFVTNPLQFLLVKGVPAIAIAWLCPAKLLIPAVVLMLLVVGWDAKELILLNA